jgi:hypothetical protein
MWFVSIDFKDFPTLGFLYKEGDSEYQSKSPSKFNQAGENKLYTVVVLYLFSS